MTEIVAFKWVKTRLSFMCLCKMMRVAQIKEKKVITLFSSINREKKALYKLKNTYDNIRKFTNLRKKSSWIW